jgi:hypothetical protein
LQSFSAKTHLSVYTAVLQHFLTVTDGSGGKATPLNSCAHWHHNHLSICIRVVCGQMDQRF